MDFNVYKESEMFDKAAEYYDSFRPGYPKEIINEFVLKAGLCKNSETLEIGSGSGKATQYFKDYGFSIRCIDPGENLIKNGKLKFSDYKNIEFECARFENLETGSKKFDAIFSAQAFHWIPKPAAYKKCSEMLKPGGFLAPFWNMYLIRGNEEDRELLRLSQKYGDFADFLDEEQCEDRISSIVFEIENSGYFKKPDVFRKMWQIKYTAEEYCGFVSTSNRFLQLPENEKKKAFTDIEEFAEKFGGCITRPYLCVMYIAQKI